MNRYKIEHNGQIYTVEAGTPDEALSFVTSQGQQQALPQPQEQPIAQGDWKGLAGRVAAAGTKTEGDQFGPVTAGQMEANRQDEARRQGELYGKTRPAGETFDRTLYNAATLGAGRLSEAYLPSWAGGQSDLPGADAHEFLKAADAARGKANPKSAIAGEVLGIAPQMLIPAKGASTAGRLGYGLATGAGLGAVEGAIESRGDAGDAAKGAAVGGIAGLAGGALAEGIGKGVQAFSRTPEERAVGLLNNAAKAERLTPAEIGARLDKLGPDAVLADVMGESGLSMVRGAGAASPEARSALNTLIDRQAGQNARIGETIEAATGYGGKSAAEIKAADRAARQPSVSAAYDELRAAGADMPSSILGPLRQSPAFNAAYEEAGKSLANRAAAESLLTGKPIMEAAANSEFARLSAVKQRFDDMAEAAARAGERGKAQEYGDLAKAVNAAIDSALPEASKARALAREGFAFGDAVDAGALLGKTGATRDTLLAAEKAAAQNPEAVAKGYGATLAEALSKRRSTPGAINALDTEFSGQAAKAALGENAQKLIDAVAREREFARTAAALGNSKTAEKLFDAKKIAAEGGLIGGLATAGYQIGGSEGATTGGLLGLGRAGLKKFAQSQGERTLKEVAPLIAQAMMQRAIPAAPASSGRKFIEASVNPKASLISALLASNLAAGASSK